MSDDVPREVVKGGENFPTYLDVPPSAADETTAMSSNLKDRLIKHLGKYRLTANAAWSEVEDKFYTQEEYEEALNNINDSFSTALLHIIKEEKVKLLEELLADITWKTAMPEKIRDRINQLRSEDA